MQTHQILQLLLIISYSVWYKWVLDMVGPSAYCWVFDSYIYTPSKSCRVAKSSHSPLSPNYACCRTGQYVEPTFIYSNHILPRDICWILFKCSATSHATSCSLCITIEYHARHSMTYSLTVTDLMLKSFLIITEKMMKFASYLLSLSKKWLQLITLS